MSDEQGEKTEEPSQHKIDESRNKGDVASSKELSSVLILAGTLSVLVLSTMFVFDVLTTYIEWLYGLDVTKAYAGELARTILKETFVAGGKCIAPVFITSLCLGVISQVSQIGLLYAPDVLELKLDRINPLSGFGRIFSKKSIAEVVKSVLKFTIVLWITYSVVSKNMKYFVGFIHSDPLQALTFGKGIALELSLTILLGLFVVAVMDFAWEKYSYKDKLKMTKQEVKEEHKEREGNPEIKQKIRAIQRQMSMKRIATDVKKGDFVVTNPTHLSVVVRYDPTTMVAPEVVAKGADHIALKIREIAKENDIPVVENIPLARALYKTVKVGHGVPRSLYKAIAEILAFVYKLKRKKKALA